MYYYTVYLPINMSKTLTYASAQKIVAGARVLVPLNVRLILGICGSEQPKPSFSCKSIVETLDTEPILPPELKRLAHWLADYYHSSIGQALFAMLPAKLQIDIDALISWTAEEVPTAYQPIFDACKGKKDNSLAELKKSLPQYPVYKMAYQAEAEGLANMHTRLKRRDKPKVQNFIRILDSGLDPESLPLKQREAWEIFGAYGKSFAMADVADRVAYHCIKALVKRGFIEIKSQIVENPYLKRDPSSAPKEIILNDEQNAAISEILEDYGSFRVHLLYGITGSGKTEVYIELMRRYLADGKGIIFLIPEIALTPQMVDRFDSSFGDILAIQHSQLTQAQRFDQWQKIKSGACRIIIGARSAIFAPVQNLGLIIVDEEHETSYKQENIPRYQGRDLAIMRGSFECAQVVLGSATPALESWNNAQIGKYRLHTLSQRPLSYSLPEVKIVNMCDIQGAELFSDALLRAMYERLELKEQIILFQNRRGFSSYLQCMKCGKLIECPNCEISMYYHRDREEMHCHYCGYFYPAPRKCPSCNAFSFAYGAAGTQKVEQSLKILFPNAKILRMDSDSSRHSSKSMYQRMKKREIDILLGTQMISKGLDFPEVTLVGIINADISLNVPDFRASERSFQLITQVAGRSGRAAKPGEVIVQTYNPEHYSITTAAKQDFEAFAAEELGYRKRLFYPPYSRLARLLYLCTSLEKLKNYMAELKPLCQKLPNEKLQILGPAPAPMPKINQDFRYHIILKAANAKTLQMAIKQLLGKTQRGIYVHVDVDPAMLM
ncbi:MAG: primosomal protein N' [Candidatus Cloacimonetes bacterium]|nr:primosomal protein N' [Candidatus Cloacimonadota bacterium]